MHHTARTTGSYAALIKLGLAPTQDDKNELTGLDKAYLGGAGLGVGVVSNAGVNAYHTHLTEAERAANKIKELAGTQKPVENVSQDLIDQFSKRRKPINVGWNPAEPFAYYQSGKNYINAKMDDPVTLAHELGHAELFRKHRPLVQLERIVTTLGGLYRPIGAYTAGALSDEDHAGTVAAVSGLSQLPLLTHEAMASQRALKQLKGIGYKGNQLKTLGAALGTYGTHALFNTGADVVRYEVGRLGRHVSKKLFGTNEASPAPNAPLGGGSTATMR